MNCTTCDSTAIDTYLRCALGDIHQCASCKAVFLPTERREVPAESLYSEDYFTDRDAYFFHDGVADRSGRESPHIADFRAGLDLMEAHVGAPGSLLDVGCATGSFLSLAKERGWRCQGVEVSAFAASGARQRTGCEVFCGTLQDVPYDDGSFDAITMWDLLEHLPHPRQGLEHALKLLKPSGVLLVNTPNEHSLLRRLAHLMYRGSGGRITAPINHLYHRFHLYYFAAETLRLLFERAGFEVAVMKTKQIPLSRGRISRLTRLGMQAISFAERLLHAEYELIVLARKPQAAPERTFGAGLEGATSTQGPDAVATLAAR